MQFELLPTQEKYIHIDHDIDIDVSMYQGGMGSGKTFIGSSLGISLCLEYPGIIGIVIAPTFDMVNKATKGKWIQLLEQSGFKKYRDWNYHETNKVLTFKNGSIVHFSHGSLPENLRSLEVGFVEMEEASLMDEPSFKEMLGRLRQSVTAKGLVIPRRRLFAHTNPEASKGWIYKHFVEKTKSTIEYIDMEEDFNVQGRTGKTRYIRKIVEEKIELNGTIEKVKVAYRLVIAPTIQNPHNPLSYVATMKSAFDTEYYNINVLGLFGDYTSGLVTKGFNSDRQICPIHFNRRYPLHLTCDFNYDPNCWFIAQVYDDNIFYLDEVVLDNSDTLVCIQEFMRRYPVSGYPEIILNGDASGGANQAAAVTGDNFVIIINALRARGYKVARRAQVPQKNPDIILRINAWNAKMCNAAGEHSIFFNAYVDAEGDLIPTTPRLIHAMDNLKFDPGTNIIHKATKSELKKDVNAKYDEHVFDGASYLVAYYFPIKRTKEEIEEDIGAVRLRDSRFNCVGDAY